MLARTSTLYAALATSLLAPPASAQPEPEVSAHPAPQPAARPAGRPAAVPPPPSSYGRPPAPGFREVFRDGAWRYEPAPSAPRPLRRDGSSGDAGAADGESWYGWQSLTADGISALTLVAGFGIPPLLAVGAGGLLLDGPVVHLAHGEEGKAVGSLGLRGVGLVGGAAIGAAAVDGGGLFGGLAELAAMAFFGGIGGGTAALIDAAVLAYESPGASARPPAARASRLVSPRLSLAPTLDAGPGRLGLGAVGRF